MQMMKKCTKCEEEKPATLEYFYKNEYCKDGLRPRCKVCCKLYDYQKRKDYYKQYRADHKEKNAEYQKQYRKNKAIQQYVRTE